MEGTASSTQDYHDSSGISLPIAVDSMVMGSAGAGEEMTRPGEVAMALKARIRRDGEAYGRLAGTEAKGWRQLSA